MKLIIDETMIKLIKFICNKIKIKHIIDDIDYWLNWSLNDQIDEIDL